MVDSFSAFFRSRDRMCHIIRGLTDDEGMSVNKSVKRYSEPAVILFITTILNFYVFYRKFPVYFAFIKLINTELAIYTHAD